LFSNDALESLGGQLKWFPLAVSALRLSRFDSMAFNEIEAEFASILTMIVHGLAKYLVFPCFSRMDIFLAIKNEVSQNIGSCTISTDDIHHILWQS